MCPSSNEDPNKQGPAAPVSTDYVTIFNAVGANDGQVPAYEPTIGVVDGGDGERGNSAISSGDKKETPPIDVVEEALPTAEQKSIYRTVARGWASAIDADVMRDWILGFNDGLSVPFALTAGLSSTGSSRIVVLAGVAELASGAISMGVGGYLSAKTELDHYRSMLAYTQQRVSSQASQTLVNDVEDVMLDRFGVDADGKLGKRLYDRLMLAEGKRDLDTRNPSFGLTPFLLHVGHQLDPIESKRVYQSALTIGLAYLCGGAIPLLPYFFCHNVLTALWISIAVTSFTLLAFGAVKQQLVSAGTVVAQGWSWRTSLYGALTTLGVGGAAAAASYGIVRAIESGGRD